MCIERSPDLFWIFASYHAGHSVAQYVHQSFHIEIVGCLEELQSDKGKAKGTQRVKTRDSFDLTCNNS